MRIWGKLVAAAVAPLMLGGCLWGPGKFTSNLALNRAGSFVLDYRGEILLQMPDKDSPSLAWDDKFAHCFEDGRTETITDATIVDVAPESDDGSPAYDDGIRQCTAAEIAKLKADFEKQAAEREESKRKENEEMAKVFGLPGSDDASNRRFAANLMKQQGWKSVTYKGKGVFDVDYHFEGRLNQDYVFPLMPEADLMIPFITIRPRTDGSVKVNAPAFTGKSGPFGARAKAMGLPDKGSEGPASRAEGRFTITTDGEILTNNSEDGPAVVQGRRQLHWDVDAGTDKIPEMMVRL
jgi:hypothetical protein